MKRLPYEEVLEKIRNMEDLSGLDLTSLRPT